MDFPPDDWPDYDPDLAAFSSGTNVLTALGVYLLGVVLTNTSGAVRTVSVTDTAGVAILNAIDVPQSGVSLNFEYSMLRMTGLKVVTDGTGVNGKAWGWLV